MASGTLLHSHARFNQLEGCMFGFYSEDEIKKLSCVEITEPKGISILQLGEPNGLHDPRMGTLSDKQQEICPVCNQNHYHCPGHIGHIRLTVPIYNPTIFKFIDQILTRKCYNCHHLLYDDNRIDVIQHKLKSLQNGYIFNINSIEKEISLLEEAHTRKFTKQLFNNNSLIKKKKKHNKHKKDMKKENDMDIVDVIDITSSDDDDDDDDIDDEDNNNNNDREENDASSKPINLDFLDKGNMKGTRQAILKLRWKLFELIFTKWTPLDQCCQCKCVRILFNRSDDCHIMQKAIGRRKKIYDKSNVKLVNINRENDTMSVDKDITIPANEVRKHFKALWETEAFIMKRLFSAHPFTNGSAKISNSNEEKKDDEKKNNNNNDYEQFFVKIIPVPPNRYRPPNFLGNRIAECSQNRQYRNILKANIAMKALIKQIQELSDNPTLSKFTKYQSVQHHVQRKQKWKAFRQQQRKFDSESIYAQEYDDDDEDDDIDGDNDDGNEIFKDKKELIMAESLFNKYSECRQEFIEQWSVLQQQYNHLTDNTKNQQINSGGRNQQQNKVSQGIRQLMEKKQGLFRMFMMGKRVNYAARSVVNPDLWVKTNEIGIPLYAAKILTYPERVQSYNYHSLRQAIINGCDIHPGANSIKTDSNKLISLKHKTLQQRKAIARTLLSNMSTHRASFKRSKSFEKNAAASRPQIVYRHIRNNDIVLVNRQPTLHKVSIMAHRVKVQHKGKVIRMHYANCNSYNADFDGDEINVHFPQSELARSEGYNIAATAKQYISVKDGSPLRGLMQDHVVASVLLTKKDTFLTRNEYTQLLFSCMQTWNPAIKIKLQPPTILKPKPLWTGKQVINTLLDSISGDLHGINMEKKTRTPANAWNGIENNNNNKEEGTLIIRDNYICAGILDKAQISDGQSFGLVHAIHELYGPHATSVFLTSIGQLLSTFLQSHGFSARMEDLILTQETELKRKNIIKNSRKKSILRCCEAIGYDTSNKSKPSLQGVINCMKEFLLISDKNETKLDGEMRSTLAGITNNVIGTCYPFGSFIPFPVNNFQLMILAGAKGSTVNMAQIVAQLGQQELEGHRVPRMSSGKTLPCFTPYDPSGRAGGFVTQRFLTGLRPQEYYFHSMAGREGLVDTACKTSRSGYLQRCLIKGLETLRIAYDNTVRDCNNNIIQFLYGEDSLDTSKASYLDVSDCKKYSFYAKNKKIIQQQVNFGMFDSDELRLIFDERDKFINKSVLENKKEIKKIMNGKAKRKDDTSMDFINGRLYMMKWWKNNKKAQAQNSKKHMEKYEPCVNIYNPALHFGSVSERFYSKIKKFVKTFDSENKQLYKSKNQNKNKRFEEEFNINNKDFEELMKINYAKALIDPGEMVGILAAQSIGEPSTQMTLNTFHLAGFGDRNVTLGIPRMREILMTEGKNIKTPDMSFWISPNITKPMDAAIKLKNALEPFPLSKLLISRTIQGPHVIFNTLKNYKEIHTIELTIAMPSALKYITLERVLRCLQKQFLPTLLQLITKSASKSGNNKIDVDEAQHAKDDEYNVQNTNIESVVNDNDNGNNNNENQSSIEQNDDDDDDQDSDQESEEEEHSEEEKDDELDDDSVLFGAGLTPGNTTTDYSEMEMSDNDNNNKTKNNKRKRDELPNLVTTSDDDFSDYNNDNANNRNKRKRRDFKDNDKLAEELSLKYRCFRSINIQIDEPRILCSLQIQLPLKHEALLLESLIDNVCRNYAFIRKINNVEAVHINYDKTGSENGSNWKVIVSGFNKSVFKIVEKYADLNTFDTNNIFEIYKLFGIEAARNAIIKELSTVLGAYGLDVSYRHFSLIADSMTYFGEIRPMTRKSMAQSTSPFLRITYEMAQKFMTDSCLNKDIDNITSASSAIVLGQVGKFGTGLFEIKQDIKTQIELQQNQKNPYLKQDAQLQSYYSDDEEEEDDDYNDNDDEYYE